MRLSVVHFGALDTIEVDLQPGLNAVLGRNGAGKSTFVNAFYLALVGDTLDGASCSDIITWGFSEASVTLATDTFEIVRKITPTGVKHRMTIGDEVLTKKTEITDRVISLFNLPSIETFRNVYFAEQYRAVDFIYGTNAARLDMLSNVFGLKKFETIRSRLQDASSSIAIESISDELLEQLRASAAAAEERLSVFDADNKILEEQIRSSDKLDELMIIATKSATKEEYDQINADIEKNKGLLIDIEAELKQLPVGPTAEQREEYAKAYRYQQLKPEFDAAEKYYTETISEKHPSEESILKMTASIDTQLGSLRAKREQLVSRTNLLASGKCPLTGGDPCHDLAALANPAAISADIAKVDSDIQQAESDKEQASQLCVEARIYAKKVADATARYQNLKGLISQVEAYKDFDFDAWNNANCVDDSIDKKRADLVSQLAVVKLRISEYTEKLTEICVYPIISDVSVRKTAQDAINESNIASVQLEARLAVRKQLSDEVNNAVTQYTMALRSANDSVKLRATKAHLNKLRDLLHRDNVPRLLLEGVRDDLNAKLDEYISLFDLPYELNWTAEGDLLYRSPNSEWMGTKSLSGGQKYILMLALRWSLAELLNSVFPVLVLDEPTTGLDVNNRRLLAETLLSISDILGNRGMSLLIPTHDETIIQNAQNIIKIGG